MSIQLLPLVFFIKIIIEIRIHTVFLKFISLLAQILLFVSDQILLLLPQHYQLIMLFRIIQNQLGYLRVKYILDRPGNHFRNTDFSDMRHLAQHSNVT